MVNSFLESKGARPSKKGRTRLPGLLLAAVCLGALGLWALRAPGTPAGDRRPWSLLVISIDTLRADFVSAYGEGAATPHIDRLAREGVLFEHAQSVAPLTLPAHASLFTATIPPHHGVRDNVGFYLPDNARTLARHLEAQGYQTGGFVGAFVLDARFGIGRGFETYDDDVEGGASEVSEGFVSQRRGDAVLDRALAWLEAARARPEPFFAFVHFYDPHTPYAPPSPFAEGADDDRARYRGEVAYTDTLVGRLLDWLDAQALTDRTLVVLTSDQGESLGEHGERTHGLFVYESALHIPLLLRYPGAPAGTRVSGLVRLIDVAPTVLDLMRLPALDPSVDGVSLVPVIEDPGREGPPSAYAETCFPRLQYGWSELSSLRAGRHKLILAPRPELYDLEDDPGERHNLFDAEPDVAARLRRELNAVAPAAAKCGPAAADAAVDDETRARLAALGYVGSGDGRPSLADPKDRLELYHTLNDPGLSSVDPSEPARYREALARLERAIDEEPTIPRAYLLYGELLLKGGRAKEATKVFERLIGFDASYQGLYGLGMAFQSLGELDRAEAAYRRALAREPHNTKSHYRLAEIAEARGNVDAAKDWLSRAIELSPNRVLKEKLATLLLSAGRRDEARAVLDALVREHGDDPLALYNLGQSLLVGGDAEAALEMFHAASRADPSDADIHQGIGNALQALGRLDEAAGAYRRAVDLAPCFAGAYSNLGATLMRLGRMDEAIVSMRKALECDPSYILGYKNLAAVQLENKDLAGAIETLSRGRARAPKDAEIARHLRELEAFRERLRN